VRLIYFIDDSQKYLKDPILLLFIIFNYILIEKPDFIILILCYILSTLYFKPFGWKRILTTCGLEFF